jgi:uncharacterized protein YkwD
MPGFALATCRTWAATLGLMLAVVVAGCTEPPPEALDGFDISKGLSQLRRGTAVEPAEADAWRSELIKLINDLRTANDLWPLVEDPTLTEMAGAYAERMIEEGFFGHLDPDTGCTVGDRARDAGYHFWKVGENLAAGYASPLEVFQAWQDSPEHQANLLDPDWREVGIGIRAGGDYGLYVVAEFAWPQH